MLTKLSAIRAHKAEDEKGFTLIELLVVVLIIGILAAIAIPVFIGQQNTAKDSAAKSDLGNAKIALVSLQTNNSGTIPTTITLADLSTNGFTPSSGTSAPGIYLGTGTTTGYCIEETAATGNAFHITDNSGVAGGTCAAVTLGGVTTYSATNTISG